MLWRFMEEPPQQPALEPPAADAEVAEIAATVEAILLATDAPLSAARIAQVAELPGRREVRQAVEQLNEKYERMGCAFRIEQLAGGYQMLTLPEYHDVVGRLLKAKGDSRLSQAAMETLAVVAYRQPVLRADIEAIRGVACGEVLRGLIDKQLVKIVGRAEVLGRPMLYGTTRRFLDLFGLSSLKDLPKVEELRSGAAEPAGAVEALAAPSDAPPPADAPAEAPIAADAPGESDEPHAQAGA